MSAAIISLTINLGAYATEIVRAGFQAVPRTQVEAGQALGLSGRQVFRHVILFPALKMMFPALASQFILLMLATSIASQIAVQDLFHAGSIIQSRTFRTSRSMRWSARSTSRLHSGSGRSSPSSTTGRSADDDPGIRPHRCLLPRRRDALDVAAPFVAFVGGGCVGLCVAILRVAPFAPLRWLAIGSSSLCRASRCSSGSSSSISAWRSSGLRSCPGSPRAFAFSVYGGAFLGEIWRGALQAIPRTQWEAGAALGLGFGEQLRWIIVPQAVRIATPPTVGFLVQLIKNTSLAATIGFVELTREAS